MGSKLTPLIVGGFFPALFYGLAGILQKWSAREGGSVSSYLISFGLATIASGIVFRLVLSDGPGPTRSIAIALLAGAAFGAGAGLVSPSIIRYGAAIAQLSPLYNLNVLIIVVLGLLIFSEFGEVQVSRSLPGATLTLLGRWLVSSA